MIQGTPDPLTSRLLGSEGAGEAHGRYTIRPYEPGDEEPILATFNRVFQEDAKGPQARTLPEWRWAYPDNPAGMRVWIALDEGRVVAHYASRPARTLVAGQVGRFTQIVDSMVHPDYRRSLKSPGLFARTGHRMLSATCGAGKDLVAFGWPTHEAWRVGERLLGYLRIRQEVALVLDPWPGGAELPAGIEFLTGFDERVDRLYARCSGEWGASTIRDATYLNWRVTRHPRHPYRILGAVRPDGELAGYAIYRSADWLLSRSALLCDWLVPADDPATGAALLEGLLAAARTELTRTVIAFFPEWSPWVERLKGRGFKPHPIEYSMVSGSYNDPRYDVDWLRRNWWYQLLDLDLV